MQSVSKQELIEEYRRLADELDKKPTLSDFNEKGEYSSTPVYKRFESFEELKDAAGFEKGQQKISDEELLDDLRRVADEIGRTPPVEVYREYGGYDYKTLARRWGSWNDVQKEAGLEPTEHSEHWEGTEYDYEPPEGNVEVRCDYCGELTPKWEYELDSRENVYCDRDCNAGAMSEQTGEDARSWEGGKVPVECEICGTVERVRPAKVDKSRFCSQPCMLVWRSDYLSGENHPRWKDNPQYRYYGPNWEEQSEKCRERDGYECQVCGRSNESSTTKWDESLTAHHIIRFYDFDGYEIANQLPNLVASCKTCHGYLDAGKAEIPQQHEKRFREWVQGIEKDVSDATVKLE